MQKSGGDQGSGRIKERKGREINESIRSAERAQNRDLFYVGRMQKTGSQVPRGRIQVLPDRTGSPCLPAGIPLHEAKSGGEAKEKEKR